MSGQTNGGVFNPKNLSLFTYTYNNPINLVDPDGEAPKDLEQFVPRNRWSKVGENSKLMTKSDGGYERVVLHHSGSATTPQGVEKIHRDKEGFKGFLRHVGSKLGLAQSYEGYGDVGYNFLIDEKGKIFEGRNLKYIPAHLRGKNKGSIGIVFLGDYSEKSLSNEQINSYSLLLGELDEQYNLTNTKEDNIFTHAEADSHKANELKSAQKVLDYVEQRHREKGE